MGLTIFILYLVRVVNVEKEVWVCVDDQMSKITFIDYAHEEMMVRSTSRSVEVKDNDLSCSN